MPGQEVADCGPCKETAPAGTDDRRMKSFANAIERVSLSEPIPDRQRSTRPGYNRRGMDVIRLSCLAFCAAAVLLAAFPVAPKAAVTRDQFPPQTTSDLIALCSAGKDDPLMTAAVNFCQGFVEGASELAIGYGSTVRKDRQPFCLPMPRPSNNDALAQFVVWANAEPQRLQAPAVVGLLQFLIQQYPCPRAGEKRTPAK
jgi:hypothetical protein